MRFVHSHHSLLLFCMNLDLRLCAAPIRLSATRATLRHTACVGGRNHAHAERTREQRTRPIHLRLPVISRWKKERFAYDYNRTVAKHLQSPLTSWCRRSEIPNLRECVGLFHRP